ncbi:hypothetical protein AQ436_06550 [Arthrobacter sp. EpRS66]|nr:hypothetical protein AQ436_06550 [Arthrobacter sp. EpRS66]
MESIFCGHLAVFSETFPTSGMTRNGVAYELPTWERRMADSASSSLQPDENLLRTPTASEVSGGMMDPHKARAEGRTIRLAAQMVNLANPGQLLPTPMTSDTKGSAPGDMDRNSPQLRAINQILGTDQ